MTNPQNSGYRIPLRRGKSSPVPGPEASKLRVPVERIIDHCWLFIDGVRQPGEYHHSTAMEQVQEVLKNGQEAFIWLSLHEPDYVQMQKIGEEFDVHSLIVEDAVQAHQRPKVERYDDQLFFVVRAVKYADFEMRQQSVSRSRQVIETGEVQAVVGRNFVITIRHNTPLPSIRDRFEQTADVAVTDPMTVAWAISDALVDDYIRIVEELRDDVDQLEEDVFSPGNDINVDYIYLLKREILEMRHAIDPLDPALRMLISGNKDLLSKELRSYFRDVLDHEIVAKDEIAGFDERLSALINAAVAKVSLQQNSDMRTISAAVGMAAVPTLIAGIYGMNFVNMPELEWEYGYYIILGVIAFIMLLMWAWFRKMRWL